MIFKYLPLAAASVWMAINLFYEKDTEVRRKNAFIELLYCMVMAAVAIFGYYTKLYFVAAVLLIGICLIYILIINPKFMNRQLVRRDRSDKNGKEPKP